MGPINLLLLGLGGAYLHACSRQATPMQNYLAGCCWSKNRASLRLRYHSPVSLLAGLENVIGGPRGLAYALGPSGLLTDGEVIELRADDPTPELDRATPHRLDGTEYLQPKDSA
ncbi:hypothetical protein CXK94_02760 [Stutzerimonas stutzeri]|uniref:Uncharacterized protein n=2 Tax=Stutzerimonas stutzeri TaxID=316 RepID=A0A2N8T9S4_STUST|nr:hypothetical protein CXK94_02760 [Stutzerimonas stutzeri]